MSKETQSPVNAVEVKDLFKVFHGPVGVKKVVAVKGLSFHIRTGEVYGLIGPNGSGKSTTMKVILGLISATRGQTSVFGIDSGKVGSRRDVGFLPENPYFYKHLSGEETLKFYGKLCGLNRAELKQKVPDLLELVGLTDARKRAIGGYSKGMLQRIGLAQALIHDPRLVVLDEPTAGVDPAGSRQIRDLILELKNRGISIILSSHLLEQVQEVCDRVGIIYKGEMVREGTLEELTAINDQVEVVLKGDADRLEERVREALADLGDIVSIGRPRATLERLFIEATSQEEPKEKEASIPES